MAQEESSERGPRASSQNSKHPPAPPSSVDFLAGGGEMGERMRALDWSSTPVGPADTWPSSLKTLVATSLQSRFPIVIWWDQQHYTTFYNDAYISILGKTKHPGWLGRSGKECWQEIWPTIGPMLEGVFATGQPTWSEDLLLVLDRNLPLEEAYFTFSYSAIPGKAGGVDGIFCAVTETTERVLSERRLRTLRDLASLALETRSAEEACEVAADVLGQNQADLPFALIYLLNHDRTVAHLAALSGMTPGSQAALPTLPVVASAPTSLWPLDAVATQARPLHVSLSREDFGTLPGGPWPESPETALILPLMEPGQNQVTGFLVAGVNPRRVLDAAYQDFFTLVAGQVATAVANARAYEEERRRAEALAELDRAKTLFFSNVSHEFRTPLTLLLGPLEDLLAGNRLAPEQHAQLELMHRNGLRLLKLVNTLLDFSRIESGRAQAVYTPTSLAAYTADLASVFRSLIERAGLHLIIDCPPLPEPVYVDREMWEKIVLNLLSNAFKFTFEGEIAVTLHQVDRQVQLVIRDTGTGIPAEELPRLFERFHRVQGARSRTHEGSGIGLALVQELVHLHGGAIRVQSQVNEGTTFIITLPLGTAHLPAERIQTSRTQSSTALGAAPFVEEAQRWLPDDTLTRSSTSDWLAQESPSSPPFRPKASQERPARILLADDNADLRDYLGRVLRARYEVEAVADGAAALSAIRQRPPDLVLSDVMMPELDGFGLLRELRADPRTRAIPVILLSARAGEEATIEGLEAGADDYLIKPFSARELLARVEGRLEMTRLRQESLANASELEAVFEAMTDGIDIVDARGHIRQMNQAGHHILGLRTQEEARAYFTEAPEGRSLMLAMRDQQGNPLPPERAPAARVVRGETLAGKSAMDVQVRTLDGREQQWEFSGAPTRDVAGNIVGGVVVFRDVTERRALERRTQEALDALLHLVQTLVVAQTPNSMPESAQQIVEAVRRILGCEVVSLAAIDADTQRWIPLAITGSSPEDATAWWAALGQQEPADRFDADQLRRLRAGEAVVSDLTRHARQNLPTYGAKAAATTPLLDQGRLTGMLTIAYQSVNHHFSQEDLALAAGIGRLTVLLLQRNRLLREQAQMQVEQQRLLHLIDLAHDAVIVRDPSGAILSWNQGAERLYGWTEQEALGQITHILLATRFPGAIEEAEVRLATEGQWEGLLTHTRRDGVQVIVESRQVLVRESPGVPSAILEINRDVTEREQLLRERAAGEARVLALEETTRRMDEFLGIASHELRTPLTSINANVQMLERHLGRSTQRDSADGSAEDDARLTRARNLAERTKRQVTRMNRLVGDLLDGSRISAGNLEFQLERIDLVEVVREVVEAQRLAWPTRKILLEAPGEAPLIGDADRLGQVVTNYLTNALKYSAEDQPVAVSLRSQDGWARLEVRDQGPGIDPEQQSHLWERFYRVPGITQRSGSGVGLGLGLYICQTIISRHGGQVGVDSVVGEGSTFWFRLPLTP